MARWTQPLIDLTLSHTSSDSGPALAVLKHLKNPLIMDSQFEGLHRLPARGGSFDYDVKLSAGQRWRLYFSNKYLRAASAL
jgi:hypothetical protein